MKNMPKHRPILLMILDGWGYREDSSYNAIAKAHIPHWDTLWQQYPHTLLNGSGHAVGLPNGQMGNSEVGHLTIGSGRVVDQDLTRVDKAIEDKDFFQNPVFLNTLDYTAKHDKALHILGLLSPGGVHSHEKHIQALVKLACQKGVRKVYVHAFLDGRDVPPRSAKPSLQTLEHFFETLHCGKIASIIGRYFAMDRDKRWDRTKHAYDLLTLGKAPFHASSAIEALNLAYARSEDDEFVQATTIGEPVTIQDNDSIIFMNFRSDRARQLSRAFIQPDFHDFHRVVVPKLYSFVSLTEYATDIPSQIAFPSYTLSNILGEYLSDLGLKQLRIAETEKYAHVTFFFNGGVEQPFPGEDRILIHSPNVPTYDLQPEMSAPELTTQLIQAIQSQKYDVIVCNFANADMVGHSGNLGATIRAIETLDHCIGKIVTAIHQVGGEILITADHGNAECMYDEQTKQPHTAHTSDPVPFIYVGRPAKFTQNTGKLSDVAPTLLYLMGLPIPKEMTGQNLLELKNTQAEKEPLQAST